MTQAPADAWAACHRAQAHIIVVTGEIGAGKTTWCHGLITHVRQAGLRVAGLLSPGAFVDGQKAAIDLLDLASDEKRRMADRLAVPDAASPTPNWRFNPQTLAWGDAVLKMVDTCDLLVIDELGPLELRHNQGWQSALPLLKRGNYRVACVVVRPLLLAIFLAAFPDANVMNLSGQAVG